MNHAINTRRIRYKKVKGTSKKRLHESGYPVKTLTLNPKQNIPQLLRSPQVNRVYIHPSTTVTCTFMFTHISP